MLKFGQSTSIFSSKSTNSMENVGIVKGIQQMKTVHLEVKETFLNNSPHSSPKKNSYCGSDFSDHALESPSHRVAPPYKDPPAPPPYRDPPPPSSNVSSKKNVYQVSIRTIFKAGTNYKVCDRKLIKLNGVTQNTGQLKMVWLMLNIGN